MNDFKLLNGTIVIVILSLVYIILDRTISIDVRLVKDIHISYSDLLAIILAAVSLIVTLASFVLAIAAFIGWSRLKKEAIAQAKKSVEESVNEGGEINVMIKKRLSDMTYGDISVQVDSEKLE